MCSPPRKRPFALPDEGCSTQFPFTVCLLQCHHYHTSLHLPLPCFNGFALGLSGPHVPFLDCLAWLIWCLSFLGFQQRWLSVFLPPNGFWIPSLFGLIPAWSPAFWA